MCVCVPMFSPYKVLLDQGCSGDLIYLCDPFRGVSSDLVTF